MRKNRIRQAKLKAKDILKDVEGVTGIGVTWDEDGKVCIRVNVSSPDIRDQIPATIDDIPIQVEVISCITFLQKN